MMEPGAKKWTWEEQLKTLLLEMTFEERLRFMIRYAHAHRARQKLGKRVPPRFWGNREQHHRLIED